MDRLAPPTSGYEAVPAGRAIPERKVVIDIVGAGGVEIDRWFRSLVDASADVIHVLDPSGVTRYVSASSRQVFGRAPGEMVGRKLCDLVDPADAGLVDAFVADVLAAPTGGVVDQEIRVHDRGRVRWLNCRATNHLATPGLAGIVATWQDVTGPHDVRTRLQFAATHDLLTGLPNRAVFGDRLVKALAGAARRRGDRIAVLFCDLDHFKDVNDRFGHAAGDDLLRQVGARLLDAVRPSDTVARIGGDEFAVVCDMVASQDEAHAVADRIVAAVADRYRLEGAPPVEVGISVGIALSKVGAPPAEDETALVRRADIALYEAKRRGKGRVVTYGEHVHARRWIAPEFRRALEEGQLRLLYQPTVDVATGATVGAEALLRWDHPVRGVLSPAAFLARAEDCGAIVEIGAWVLDEAARQVSAWRGAGVGIDVAVNLSPTELRKPGLVDGVGAAFTGHGLDPSALTVHVSERTTCDSPETRDVLARMRAQGVRVALDGFGSGPTSILSLHDLPLDVVCVDGSLFAGRSAPAAAALMATILDVCHARGLVAVATAVETPEHLRIATDLGYDRAQGHQLGEPVPAARIGRGQEVDGQVG